MKKIGYVICFTLLLFCSVFAFFACEWFVPCQHESTEWEIIKNATCIETGSKELRCIRDDFVLDSAVIPMLGHNYQLTDKVEPTCTIEGLEKYTCSHDSTHTYVDTLSILEHNYSDWQFFAATTSSAPEQHIRTCKNNSSHVETRYVAPIIELGVVSPEVSINNGGTWFMLVLENETNIQLGFLQSTYHAISVQCEAYLYTNTLGRLMVSTPKTLGIADLSAGTYFVKLAFYGNGYVDANIRIDDFSEIIATVPVLALDIYSAPISVYNIGTWYQLELMAETLVQFHTSTDPVDSYLFSENSMSTPLLGSGSFDTNVGSLPKGLYYIRVNSVFAGQTPSCSIKIIDLESRLDNASQIVVDSPSEVVTVDQEGIWFKIVLDKKLPISFTFEGNSLAARLYHNDDNLTQFARWTANSFPHNKTILAGTYYILIFANSYKAETGSFLITNLTTALNEATLLALDVPEPVTVTEGRWFRFSLAEMTNIRVVAESTTDRLRARIYSADNLSGDNHMLNDKGTLPAGDYFVFVYSIFTSLTTGTITINDLSIVLNDSSQLIFDMQSEETVIVGVDDKWLKLIIVEEVYVRFTVSSITGSLSAGLYAEDNFSKVINVGISGGLILAAGTYYIEFSFTGIAGTDSKGTILIEKI